MARNKFRAQSLVEYVLLLAVIIGTVIVAFYSGTHSISHRVNDTYNKMGDVIENVTNNLTEQVFGGH